MAQPDWRRRRVVSLAALSLAALAHLAAVSNGQTNPPPAAAVASDTNPDAAAEAKIRHELARPTTMEFIEEPLQNVLDFLGDVHGIEIVLHPTVANDIGVTGDTPITADLKRVSLRSALNRLLEAEGLTYVVRDGMLLVISPDFLESTYEVRVYDVADLIQSDDADELAMLLWRMVAPSTMALKRPLTAAVSPSSDAVASDVVPLTQTTPVAAATETQFDTFGKLLIVRASLAEHEALDGLLAKLREKLLKPGE